MYRKCTTQVHVAALYSQQIDTEGLALGFEKNFNISPNYLHSSSLTATISASARHIHAHGLTSYFLDMA